MNMTRAFLSLRFLLLAAALLALAVFFVGDEFPSAQADHIVTLVTGEALTDEERLLAEYDGNDDGIIDLDEVSLAIDDFFRAPDDPDKISLEEVSIVIDLYFS